MVLIKLRRIDCKMGLISPDARLLLTHVMGTRIVNAVQCIMDGVSFGCIFSVLTHKYTRNAYSLRPNHRALVGGDARIPMLSPHTTGGWSESVFVRSIGVLVCTHFPSIAFPCPRRKEASSGGISEKASNGGVVWAVGGFTLPISRNSANHRRYHRKGVYIGAGSVASNGAIRSRTFDYNFKRKITYHKCSFEETHCFSCIMYT